MALRILRLFMELNRVGATVLIASHDTDLVARSGMPVLQPRRRTACAAAPPFRSAELRRMSLAFDASRWWPAPLLPRGDGRDWALLFVVAALSFLAGLAAVGGAGRRSARRRAGARSWSARPP